MLKHTPRSAEAIAADRARYDEHQRKGLNFAPKAIPEPSARPAPAPEGVLWQEVVPGGWYYTCKLEKGQILRLQSGGLGASATLAAWSAADTSERQNLPDTCKLQWTTDLKKGRVVFSDMGRVLFSIVEDSAGATDALSGGMPATAPFTPAFRSVRENMLIAVAKLGLDKRDLPALISFFAPVRVDAEGGFFWNPALLNGDDWVEIRAEMDMLVAISNTRHPLDPTTGSEVPALTATRIAARPIAEDDLCRTASAEAIRGFENNIRA
ncbi:MAG: urea amidolyase associated protein UAAP1 [Paenirhodobacter sp.]|uniref:urea amidolyase associated protein UAAP1 n=1 Tax=Paenirhodobacter sp. TaxID=1965326 RepID=UPI003D100FF2